MNPESGFFQALSLAADIVIINVLMILTSIPVITVGASLRAGNYVIAELIAESGSRPARTYLSEFKRNMVVSTAWWLIILVLTGLFVVEWLLLDSTRIDQGIDFTFRIGLISGLFIVSGISLWIFYEEAMHPKTFHSTFIKAATLSIHHFPRTLVGLGMLVLPVVLLVHSPQRWSVLLSFYLIIGFALTLYLFQLVIRGVTSSKERS